MVADRDARSVRSHADGVAAAYDLSDIGPIPGQDEIGRILRKRDHVAIGKHEHGVIIFCHHLYDVRLSHIVDAGKGRGAQQREQECVSRIRSFFMVYFLSRFSVGSLDEKFSST